MINSFNKKLLIYTTIIIVIIASVVAWVMLFGQKTTETNENSNPPITRESIQSAIERPEIIDEELIVDEIKQYNQEWFLAFCHSTNPEVPYTLPYIVYYPIEGEIETYNILKGEEYIDKLNDMPDELIGDINTYGY